MPFIRSSLYEMLIEKGKYTFQAFAKLTHVFELLEQNKSHTVSASSALLQT